MSGRSELVYRVRESRAVRVAGRHYRMVVENAAVAEVGEVPQAILDRMAGRERFTTGEIIESLRDRVPAHTVKEALDECVALELLDPQDRTRPAERPEPSARLSPPAALGRIASLTLHVAHDCNMRCGYCYAEQGAYGGERGLMSAQTARQFIDLLFERSQETSQVYIQFFGGEPLLNFPVVREATEHAVREAQQRGKRVRFGLTTNGLLLDRKKAEYLASRGFTLTVSIDGPAETNDRIRRTARGGPTYDRVASVVPLLEMFPRSGARVTVTHQDPHAERIVDHLLETGFAEVGVANVTSSDPEYALTEKDYEILVEEFRRLTARFVDAACAGSIFPFSNIRNLLAQIHEGAARTHPCGAGVRLFAGTPTGELYICHRFAGKEPYRVGDLACGPDPERQRGLLDRLDVRRKTECARCWLRSLCAGGCYSIADVRLGDACRVDSALCPWLREWFQLGLETYVLLTQRAPEFLAGLVGEPDTCFA